MAIQMQNPGWHGRYILRTGAQVLKQDVTAA